MRDEMTVSVLGLLVVLCALCLAAFLVGWFAGRKEERGLWRKAAESGMPIELEGLLYAVKATAAVGSLWAWSWPSEVMRTPLREDDPQLAGRAH